MLLNSNYAISDLFYTNIYCQKNTYGLKTTTEIERGCNVKIVSFTTIDEVTANVQNVNIRFPPCDSKTRISAIDTTKIR